MALNKKVYGVNIPFSARMLAVYGIIDVHPKAENPLRRFSEIGNLAGLELKLQFVSDQGDEF